MGCRYITNEKFYFLPVKPAIASKSEVLEIDRVNFEFNLIGKAKIVSLLTTPLAYAFGVDTATGLYSAENRKISVLLGIIHLLSGKYMWSFFTACTSMHSGIRKKFMFQFIHHNSMFIFPNRAYTSIVSVLVFIAFLVYKDKNYSCIWLNCVSCMCIFGWNTLLLRFCVIKV